MKHFQHMTMTWKSKKVRSTENQQNLPKTPHASGLGLDRCQVLQRLGNKKTNRTWASNSCWWYFVVWDTFGLKISTFLRWFYHLRLGGFNPLVKLDHFHLAVGDKSFVWFMRCHVWLWIYICTWMHAGLQNRMSVWAHMLHIYLCVGFRSRIYMWNHQTQHILTPTCVCIPATYKHGCMSAYDSHMQFRSDWSLYRNPSLKMSCFVKCTNTITMYSAASNYTPIHPSIQQRGVPLVRAKLHKCLASCHLATKKKCRFGVTGIQPK